MEANAKTWKLADFRWMDFRHTAADQNPDAKDSCCNGQVKRTEKDNTKDLTQRILTT